MTASIAITGHYRLWSRHWQSWHSPVSKKSNGFARFMTKENACARLFLILILHLHHLYSNPWVDFWVHYSDPFMNQSETCVWVPSLPLIRISCCFVAVCTLCVYSGPIFTGRAHCRTRSVLSCIVLFFPVFVLFLCCFCAVFVLFLCCFYMGKNHEFLWCCVCRTCLRKAKNRDILPSWFLLLKCGVLIFPSFSSTPIEFIYARWWKIFHHFQQCSWNSSLFCGHCPYMTLPHKHIAGHATCISKKKNRRGIINCNRKSC